METNSLLSPEALLAFDALARLGSFTAAADHLGCAKSRVSVLVRELERELGTVLVLRTTRRVALTEAGERLARHARVLRETLERARPDVQAAQDCVSGPLQISATASVSQFLLPPLLAELAVQLPQLEIRLEVENRLQDLVADGIDFCIRTRRVHDEALVARLVGFAGEALYASPAYLARHGTPESLCDLVCHRALIDDEVDACDPHWRLTRQGETCRSALNVALNCNHGSVLAGAAVAGQGITLLPQYCSAPHVARGELVRVLPEWSGEQWPIYLVYPYRQPQPRKYQAFIEFFLPRLTQSLEMSAAVAGLTELAGTNEKAAL
ncbi:LysR substrate-binding domain-containing protein [Crenobacter sp. SG2305]|uniref:LysR substrate-binding domain-containing protein n=1 Tax=Crenobacter oryzisoli TaxID=3056844 RepID=UPI0025AA3B42|nr:LysR substrate-binding domain-containing protein [Crenobacter sp. SG2305]MDN0083316.1 LysR substrate-binding domain-containing protein [Crenobacter sp. SG2305]